MNTPQNETLFTLFDSFMDFMTPVLELQSISSLSTHWQAFNNLLQERPLNYFGIQQFLANLDTNPQEQSLPLYQTEMNSNKSAGQSPKQVLSKRAHRNTTYDKFIPETIKQQFNAMEFAEFSQSLEKIPETLVTDQYDQYIFLSPKEKLDGTNICLFKLLAFLYFYSLLQQDIQLFEDFIKDFCKKQIQLQSIFSLADTSLTEKQFYTCLMESFQSIIEKSVDQSKRNIQLSEFYNLIQNNNQFYDCIVILLLETIYNQLLLLLSSGDSPHYQQELQDIVDYLSQKKQLYLTRNHLDLILFALGKKFQIYELDSATGNIEIIELPTQSNVSLLAQKLPINKLTLFLVTNLKKKKRIIIGEALLMLKNEFQMISTDEEFNTNIHFKCHSQDKIKARSNKEKIRNKTMNICKQVNLNGCSRRLQTDEHLNKVAFNLNNISSREFQKNKTEQILDQPISQCLLQKTIDIIELFNKNTNTLNCQLIAHSQTPTRKKVHHTTPQPLIHNATYFQTYNQQNNYPIYNPRPVSQYQPQFAPPNVYNKQQMHYQQQICHQQQHSFQYYQNSYYDKGIAKNTTTIVGNNGYVINKNFY